MKIDTLIFDMDGVITTEEKYWACARLAFWEFVTKSLGLEGTLPNAVEGEAARLAVVPDELIYTLKGRAVNSNWDITYILGCAYLLQLKALNPSIDVTGCTTPEALIATLRTQIRTPAAWPAALETFLSQTSLEGRDLIDDAGRRTQAAFGIPELFEPEKAFWWYLHARFQRFYHGEAMIEYGGTPLTDGTVIPAEAIRETLHQLRQMGFVLGTATGRPLDELNDALGSLGLLDYLDPKRLGTLEKVREAERSIGRIGLVKPHPFSLLYALYPEKNAFELTSEALIELPRPNVAMIGDSTSDIVMGKAAGCYTIGVMTGVRGEAAKRHRKQLLEDAGADVILDDITALPAYLNSAGTDA